MDDALVDAIRPVVVDDFDVVYYQKSARANPFFVRKMIKMKRKLEYIHANDKPDLQPQRFIEKKKK